MQRVLIVEDNLEIQELLTAVLKPYFEVQAEENGKAGYKRVKDFQPDLMIVDANIPTIDGFSLCKMLKDDFETRHIRIVIYTAAYATQEGRTLSLHAGADAFITKPARMTEMLDCIFRLLALDPPAEFPHT